MKLLKNLGFGILLSCALLSPVLAGDKGSRDEAVSLTKKAVAFFGANGGAKTYAEINSNPGRFVDRDLYVYVIDTKGIILAHGATPKVIGKDLSQVRDADGTYFVQQIIALVTANKAGWVDYKWVNPVTKQIESKSTYVEPIDGLGFAVGVYR
ncbi:histidine kinase [Duganella sp. BJB488]|uniref:cache domain-containing protein n=1 Tax=unclassified Duganella TaxID=2636909 RepID=UPI000E34D4AA|nr:MULTISPECIES: cache domain-containing protein [unclassified Duganella]RFP13156.1 histidine kinase [Duganella sp. BJB489]RFP17081.1 histidine kinase [Duganella sp. BJB488]RFP31511.1 histidine kinase [Duganella sp. BJB480]